MIREGRLNTAERRLPVEVYADLQVGDRKELEKEVTLIFDKGQALIRFPTNFNLEMGWKKGDKLKVRVEEGEPRIIQCELVKKKND